MPYVNYFFYLLWFTNCILFLFYENFKITLFSLKKCQKNKQKNGPLQQILKCNTQCLVPVLFFEQGNVTEQGFFPVRFLGSNLKHEHALQGGRGMGLVYVYSPLLQVGSKIPTEHISKFRSVSLQTKVPRVQEYASGWLDKKNMTFHQTITPGIKHNSGWISCRHNF